MMAKPKTVIELVTEKTPLGEIQQFGKKHKLNKLFQRFDDIDFFNIEQMSEQEYKAIPYLFMEMIVIADILVYKGLNGNKREILRHAKNCEKILDKFTK